jgi:hypothetical protein
MRSKVLRSLAVSVLSLAVVAGGATSAFAVSGGVSVDYSRPAVNIRGVGSDSIFEVMQDLDTLYNRSAGCAIGQTGIVPNAFGNTSHQCLDPDLFGASALAYGGSQITTENYYHDRAQSVFPVGSGAGTNTLRDYINQSNGYGTPARNEIQAIKRGTTVPTGGTFKLTFGSVETGAIQWDATAADVKSALVATGNATAGEITAAGGPLDSATPVTLEFTGSRLGDRDLELLYVAEGSNNLTPAGPPQAFYDITVATGDGGQNGRDAALAADYARSSSAGRLAALRSGAGGGILGGSWSSFGSAFALDALGVWVGKNNKAVQQNGAGTAAAPRFYVENLRKMYAGDGAGNPPSTSGSCLTRWDNSTTATNDSVKTTLTPISTVAGWTAAKERKHTNAAGIKDTVVPYMGQLFSGSIKDFTGIVLGLPNEANGSASASALNCIPDIFKDNNPANGEHILFENNAGPICAQPDNTATSTEAPGTLNSDQAQAVYPYTFARFTQNGASASTSPCPGVYAKLSGGVEGSGGFVTASVSNIENANWPRQRQVYNYFTFQDPGGSFNINDPSTWTLANGLSAQDQAILSYVSPKGFLCMTSAQHAVDPNTGLNYRAEIIDILHKDGFGAIAEGPTGGSWTGNSACQAATT